MAANYQIELAFLPAADSIPSFTVFRMERTPDSESLRDTCWGYSLPVAHESLENRSNYWVSFETRPDFSPFAAESSFNNELTKQLLLKGLITSCATRLESKSILGTYERVLEGSAP